MAEVVHQLTPHLPPSHHSFWGSIFAQWLGQVTSISDELRALYGNGKDLSRSKLLSRFQEKLAFRQQREREIFCSSSFGRDLQSMKTVGLPVEMLEEGRKKMLEATAHVAAAALHIGYVESSAFCVQKQFLRRAKAAGVLAILEQCLEVASSADGVPPPGELEIVEIKVDVTAWRSRIDEARNGAEALLEEDDEGSDGDSSDDDAV